MVMRAEERREIIGILRLIGISHAVDSARSARRGAADRRRRRDLRRPGRGRGRRARSTGSFSGATTRRCVFVRVTAVDRLASRSPSSVPLGVVAGLVASWTLLRRDVRVAGAADDRLGHSRGGRWRREPARAVLAVAGVTVIGALLFDMLLLSRGLLVSFRDLLDTAGYDVRVVGRRQRSLVHRRADRRRDGARRRDRPAAGSARRGDRPNAIGRSRSWPAAIRRRERRAGRRCRRAPSGRRGDHRQGVNLGATGRRRTPADRGQLVVSRRWPGPGASAPGSPAALRAPGSRPALPAVRSRVVGIGGFPFEAADELHRWRRRWTGSSGARRDAGRRRGRSRAGRVAAGDRAGGGRRGDRAAAGRMCAPSRTSRWSSSSTRTAFALLPPDLGRCCRR